MFRFVLWSSYMTLASVSACDEPVVPPLSGKPGVAVPTKVDKYELALLAAAHHFAESGEVDHLRAFLDKHRDLVKERIKFAGNRKPSYGDQFTLLHRAADHGHAPVAKMLLDKGADLKADSGSGWTPLHLAVRAGHLDVVRLLVERGADMNAGTTAQPRRAIGDAPGAPRTVPLPRYCIWTRFRPTPHSTSHKHTLTPRSLSS